MKLTIQDLYDLSHSLAGDYLRQFTYPWEARAGIKDLILQIGATLPADEYDHPEEDIWIAKDAKRYPNNYIGGPCIIGHETEVRPGAFIRGSALVPYTTLSQRFLVPLSVIDTSFPMHSAG